MRRRKVLARSVRSVIEKLESRTFLSATLAEGAGTATIQGVVYNDLNGNGVLDAGEPASPGVSVSLSEVGVSYAAGTVPTVQTDANGNFSFTTLGAGQYQVRIVPDAGFVQDAPGVVDVSVSAGATATYNVGETQNASGGGSGGGGITGTLYDDVNQDYIYNPATDQFLSGDTVYLDLNGSGVLTPNDPQTTTNSTGQFTFSPGFQSIQSLIFASNTTGGTFVLDYSDASVSPALATTKTAPITFDPLDGAANALAIQDAINVIDPNGGVTVTNGADVFHYTVTYNLIGPQNFIATDPTTALTISAPTTASLSIVSTQTGTTVPPALPSIQELTFGALTSGGTFTLSISDGSATPPLATTITPPITFDPTDSGNDTTDAIANALNNLDPNGGVAVTNGPSPFQFVVTYDLDGPQNTLGFNAAKLTTAASPLTVVNVQTGSGSVPDGVFEVRVVPRTGFHTDPPGYAQVTVYSGQTITQNLGENDAVTLAGTVFQDLNGNGVQDPGEPGVAGETVFLDLGLSGSLQATGGGTAVAVNPPSPVAGTVNSISVPPFSGGIAVGEYIELTGGTGTGEIAKITGFDFDTGFVSVATPWTTIPDTTTSYAVYPDPITITNASGQYSFTNLTPGFYRVEIDSASGMVMDNPQYMDETLAPAESLGLNLGEGLPASVSGEVFSDENVNGVLDPGEPGVPNQTVFMDITNDGVDQANPVGSDGEPLWYADPSATTSATGTYTLSNLAPGTYTMRLIVPEGAIPTTPVNPSHSYTFTLGSGTTLTAQDFGLQTSDLTISVLKFPTKPVLEGTVLKAVARVTNVGNLTGSGQVAVSLYAQTTNTGLVTTTALLIGTSPTKTVKLRPGQSTLFTFTYSYPTQTASATDYVYAMVNASIPNNDMADDVSSALGPVTVTEPFIDLSNVYAVQPIGVASTVDQTPGGPISGAGEPVFLSLAVTNNGNVATTGILSFRIYLADTQQIEPTDVVLQTTTFKNVKIAPGRTKIFDLSFPYPGGSLGSKYVLVYADSGDPLGEANVTNNTAVEVTPTLFE